MAFSQARKELCFECVQELFCFDVIALVYIKLQSLSKVHVLRLPIKGLLYRVDSLLIGTVGKAHQLTKQSAIRETEVIFVEGNREITLHPILNIC